MGRHRVLNRLSSVLRSRLRRLNEKAVPNIPITPEVMLPLARSLDRLPERVLTDFQSGVTGCDLCIQEICENDHRSARGLRSVMATSPRLWSRHARTRKPREQSTKGRRDMAESVYKIIEVVGTSSESWEKAASAAVERASKTLRDLRIAEIAQLDLQIGDGKVQAYRARVKLSFKFED